MEAPDLRLLDEIAAAATPASDTEAVGGWWCKDAPDLPFRRANAALPPVGAASDPAFAGSFAAVRAWHRERGKRLIVQVSSADPAHADLDRQLAAEGLVVEAPVIVMVHDTATGAGVVEGAAEVRVGVDQGWATIAGRLAGAGEEHASRARGYARMLSPLGEHALGASCVVDGQVAGVGLAVLDRGWVGIFAMATAPGYRRRGVATAVVHALRAEAAARGGARAYLQVEVDNHGAIELYRRLGFVESHRYHYRSEGADPTLGC